MRMDFSFGLIPKIALIILPYLSFTIFSMLVALIAGSVIASGILKLRLSRKKILNKIALLYVGAIRCTPAVILIFIVFYGLPFVAQFFGADILDYPRPFFLTVALSIMFSATFSEVMRSAYLSVNKEKPQYQLAFLNSKPSAESFYRRLLFMQFLTLAVQSFCFLKIPHLPIRLV